MKGSEQTGEIIRAMLQNVLEKHNETCHRVIRNGKKIDLGRPGRRVGYQAGAGTDTLIVTKWESTGSWFGHRVATGEDTKRPFYLKSHQPEQWCC